MSLLNKMLPVAAALAALAMLDILRPNLEFHALLSVVIAATGALWVAIGVRRHLPGRMGLMLLGAAVLNLVAMVAWFAPVLAGGDTTLGQPSIADAGWLIAGPLLAAALLYALTRRERPRFVALDVLTLATAIGLVAGVGIVGPDFATSTAPFGVRMTQACYVVSDILIASAVIRVLLAPSGRPAALWLLAAGCAGLVASDIAWNWLTISGTYVPGSWADAGWLLHPLLLGMAVLHPSVQRLGATAAHKELELHKSHTVLLGIALLAAPLMLGAHSFFPAMPDVDDSLASSLAVVGGGTMLAGIVVLRFVLLLRRARRLADVAAVALVDRTRLLSESQSRYRSLVEQLPAITIVFDLREDGHVQPLYVSPQTEAILGVTASTWLADFGSVMNRIHLEDRPRIVEALAAVAAGKPKPAVEFRATRADGQEIWLGDVGAVLTDDSSGRHVQTMLFDISDAKRAQAEREAMELELRLGQKLEAVGELAAGIAHEINTPTQFVGDTIRFLRDAFNDLLQLQGIQSELHAAAEAGTVTPELLGRVRDAEESADLAYLRERVPGAFDRAEDGITRVGEIVGAMREFGHPPTAEKAPVQLNDAVSNTLVVAMNEYKYVSDIETDLGDLPTVVCNGGDINQVILNLVVNAAHAIESRGPERGAIRIRTVVDGDDVVISIGDTGCGITDAVAARMFDPFFTTKEVGRGTGQGLAITRSLVVDRHGGTITFETELGRGTTFHVRLPIGQDTAPELVAA